MIAAMTPWQFFRVVPLHSPFMLMALGAVGLFGVLILALDPSMGDDALVPVLLVQMFAASSGFAVPARRGHLDLLLTGGSTRLRIALTHLVMSIAPGLAVWLALGVIEIALGRTLGGRAFATGSLIALAVVSTLAWALTVPLPRLSGGIVWLVASFVVITSAFEWRAVASDAAQGSGNAAVMSAVYLLCPFLLVGGRVGGSLVPAVVPAIAVALLAALAAVAWITRMDVPLEAAQ